MIVLFPISIYMAGIVHNHRPVVYPQDEAAGSTEPAASSRSTRDERNARGVGAAVAKLRGVRALLIFL